MRTIILILALGLGACANLTPEQRAQFFANMQMAAQRQQQIQQQTYEQQMQSINAWGQANAARAAGQTNCWTSYVGNQAYTHCQ